MYQLSQDKAADHGRMSIQVSTAARQYLRHHSDQLFGFGATLGAPVVFFLAAFVYALIDTLSDLGNEDTSLSLAFGMWWMIIPQ